MPNIPGVPQREVTVQREVASRFDPSAINRSGGTARQVAGVADFGAQVADKYKEAEESLWLNTAILESKKFKLQEMDKRSNDPNLDVTNFADSFTEELTKYNETYAKAAPSEQARNLYIQKMKEMDLGIYEDSLSLQRQRFVEKADRTFDKNAQDLAETAYRNATLGLPNDELYNEADATTISVASIYPTDVIEEKNKTLYETIQDAEIRAKIDTNPEGAYRDLTVGKYSPGDIDFDTAVSEVFDIEGGFVEDDAGAGPTLYGVNSDANPEEYKKIKALYDEGKESKAKDLAKELYKNKYWDAIGADSLDPRMAMVAFDAAVNQGVGAAKKMLSEANGDVNKFIDLRRERYMATVRDNPEKAQYFDGWMNRLASMRDLAHESELPTETLIKYRDLAKKNIVAREAAQAKALKATQEASKIEQANNEIELANTLADPNISYDEKILQINKLDLSGQIGDDYAVEARRYIESAKEINAATNSEVMGDIVAQMYDLNAIADQSPTEYLRGIREVQKEIMSRRSSGELSATDEQKLNKQLKTLTSAKVADATNSISYSFGAGRRIIEESVPVSERGGAMRELFYAVEEENEKNMSRDERRVLYETKAREVVDQQNQRKRNDALKTLQQAKQETGVKEMKNPFKNPQEVKDAVRNGKINKDQAMKILTEQFGFE